MTPTKRPAMPVYVADWLVDGWVRGLQPEERAVYMDLLLYSWKEHGIWPHEIEDRTKLARICGVSSRLFGRIWGAIQSRFELDSRSKYVNPRLENERNRLDKRAENRFNVLKEAKNDLIGNAPKEGTPDRSVAVSSVSSSVSEKEKTLEQPSAARGRFDFGPLYDGYPNKRGKTKAIEKLKAVIRTEADFQAFKHGLDSFLRDEKRKGTEPRFHPQFITFVNKRLWEDYSDVVPSTPSNALSLFPGGMTPHESPATARTLHREAVERGYANHGERLVAEGRA